MAVEDIRCRGCGSHKTLALRGRWGSGSGENGEEALDVHAYSERPEVFAVRCVVCHMYFHVMEVIEYAV